MIKKSFIIYGGIEKIEIFRDVKTNKQFAHVTFKESRASYLALIDNKKNESRNMRPAHTHQQPDNVMKSTGSSFWELSDENILRVFKELDNMTIATLSVVCKKFNRLIRDGLFENMCRFEGETTNATEVENMLIAARRIIKCVQPKTFHMKIYRNLTKSHKWPTIAIDFCHIGKCKLSIEMEFLVQNWLSKLKPMAKLFDEIHLKRTIYDDLSLFKKREKMVWPNATVLIVSGFTIKRSIPDFSSVIAALPKLEDLFIRNQFFSSNIKDYSHGKHLRNIVFQNCSFISGNTENHIWKVVDIVKAKKNDFPLCIKFDRIMNLKTETFWECCTVGCSPFQLYCQPNNQRKKKIISLDESTYDIIQSVSL